MPYSQQGSNIKDGLKRAKEKGASPPHALSGKTPLVCIYEQRWNVTLHFGFKQVYLTTEVPITSLWISLVPS